jgi:hypothetical protein
MDELNVKVRSLAAEARIIRNREKSIRRKWRRNVERTDEQKNDLHRRYESLRRHRVLELRPEARATQLAIGFLKGRSYASMEPTAKSSPKWDRVNRLVSKYDRTRQFDYVAWLAGGAVAVG